MSEPNVEACLRATPFIDAGHPSITGLVDGLGVRELPPVDRAR